MHTKRLLTVAAISLISSAATATDRVDGTKFRSIGEGDWYRPIEHEMWVYFGANEDRVFQVLERIENAKGERANPDQPDTINDYGPGNWVYEFEKAGDAAVARARNAEGQAQTAAFKEALAYYHTASAPHTNDANSSAALNKAYEAYEGAAKGLPGSFQTEELTLDERTFKAFLHLPAGAGPHPLLVFSNGSDMSRVTSLNYYETHLLPKKIGFLSIDVPGMGHSADFDVADGRTEKLHVAAVEWSKKQSRIDTKNIFVQGVSFGGNAAARAWAVHPDLDLAGVILTCGPLHAAFNAPAEAYETFPQFTLDGVKTRLGLPVGTPTEELANRLRILSVQNVGAFDGDKINTPILAINTNGDPVAPLEEMDTLLARGSQVDRVVFDLPGHCPPHAQREAIVSAWILQNLR